jgi:arginyl-tRNA synthetase
MSLIQEIKVNAAKVLNEIYQIEFPIESVQVNDTKPEFEGDYTIVTFPFTKQTKQKPEEVAEKLGTALVALNTIFTSYNVIKGFLNLEISNAYFNDFLVANYTNTTFGQSASNGQKVMIEYSSPNTNKPIHFGHLRNIFLGYSLANILKETGHEVIKANLINDRGIHICKSMVAWMREGNGATPTSTGIKGDHLVGDYYVLYNDLFKKEVGVLVEQGLEKEVAEKQAPILIEAQELLRKWEANDEDTIQLWKTMNGWVYEGFDVTFKKLGVDFDKFYYESNTYLSGKEVALKGLKNNILYQKEDQSVWIDLEADGLDQKLLLRGDGTSVYMTQDIGTAILKYNDYQMDKSVYVIGDEQNYHMQVLKLILQKLQEPCADGIYHLSYGMVELPNGKMKSREGNVVDADDMVAEMTSIAQKNTEELGKVEGFTNEELLNLYNTLGLGALKFYLLRVDPKKKMIFNPEESIDFHGFTGPFIQYTHARISSILRKANDKELKSVAIEMTAQEKGLLKQIEQFPTLLLQAAAEYNPSLVCIYIFNLAKEYNSFLANHSILKADTNEQMIFRLQISTLVKNVLAKGLNLIGINAPERM